MLDPKAVSITRIWFAPVKAHVGIALHPDGLTAAADVAVVRQKVQTGRARRVVYRRHDTIDRTEIAHRAIRSEHGHLRSARKDGAVVVKRCRQGPGAQRDGIPRRIDLRAPKGEHLVTIDLGDGDRGRALKIHCHEQAFSCREECPVRP